MFNVQSIIYQLLHPRIENKDLHLAINIIIYVVSSIVMFFYAKYFLKIKVATQQPLYHISFFSSGHRDQIAYSLLGSFSKAQRIGYPVTRLCPLLVSVLILPSNDGSGPLLSPPSEIPPEILVYNQFSRACISLLFPPLCPFVFLCRTFVLTDSVAACVSPSVLTFAVLPPRTVRLVVLGSGVGGGA